MPDAKLPEPEVTLTPAAQTLLTEEVEAVGAAPLPNAGALAPGAGQPMPSGAAPWRMEVDPTTEYVAGGMFYGAELAYARSLPAWIDDISRDFGADIYERMALDAHVAGETNAYKLSVLAGGVSLLPSHGAPADDTDIDALREHNLSKQVKDFCQACLDELDTPLGPVLHDMLWAFGLGNRAAEIVWRLDGRRLMPCRIKVKRRDAIAYVQDNRGNTVGLLGAIAGQAQITVRPGTLLSSDQVPNLLPRSKFAVLTWRPKDNDVRGTSSYRPAYNAWWQKRQTEIELAKYITQFAGSSIIATAGDKSQDVPLRNPDGTQVIGPNGLPAMLSPQQAILNALLQLRNGAVAALPHGAEVKNLVAIGAGQPFFQQLDRCNAEISKALLSTTLATNDSKHESRAASQTHKSVMDLMVEEGESALSTMLRRDVLRQVVLLNFGPDYLPYVPHVSLSASEEADVAEMLKAYAAAGYQIDESQTPEIDAALGLKPRDLDAIRAEREEQALRMAEQMDGAEEDEEDEDDGASRFSLFSAWRKKKARSRRA